MKKINKFWKIWFSQVIAVIGTISYTSNSLYKHYNPENYSFLIAIISFIFVALGCFLNQCWSNND
jgi:uncharacterized membrane protein YhaH (DUF805 family)